MTATSALAKTMCMRWRREIHVQRGRPRRHGLKLRRARRKIKMIGDWCGASGAKGNGVGSGGGTQHRVACQGSCAGNTRLARPQTIGKQKGQHRRVPDKDKLDALLGGCT
jgi:hypothetical protein